ncbi:MAG: protein TolQ [Betaproteobacteria bacterium]|nr:protein TolQ [Betaproteobacteria bacterium]MBL8533091.1 protein TolQ [Betaproteobacteria bacterium]
MNFTTDLSIVHLVTNASFTVQLVMLLLLVLSLFSWLFIFQKMFGIRAAKLQTEEFEKAFRNAQTSADLNALLQKAANHGAKASSIERICLAGYREFARLRRQPGQSTAGVMDGVRRAMRATYQREMDHIEAYLNFLATVGSVSPYIGLFGTVWGIMNSFRGLANVGQATLANVAPGIAEALVATAIGLFAAIPAVIAYNHYARDVDRLANRFESQMEEFQNLLLRAPQS